MTLPEKTWWSENVSDPKTYGTNVNFRGKKFVVHLLGEDTQTLLDAGCGNGLVYKAAKTMGRTFDRYKGIDLSIPFVNACREMYPEAEWEQGDVTDMHEPDGSFDTVLLYHVLECCGDYKKPIRDALRIATKRVVVVFWKGLTPDDKDIIQPTPPYGFASMFAAKGFFEFLKEIGYYYTPWVEYYADSFRYNLYFVFDKTHKRTESGVCDDSTCI